jgi:hypothetical protein
MPTIPTDPDEMTLLQRLRFYLFEPWWRAAWFLGAIVWGVVLNVLYISGGAQIELLGILSVVPLFAFIIESQGRARKIRQEKARAAQMKL